MFSFLLELFWKRNHLFLFLFFYALFNNTLFSTWNDTFAVKCVETCYYISILHVFRYVMLFIYGLKTSFPQFTTKIDECFINLFVSCAKCHWLSIFHFISFNVPLKKWNLLLLLLMDVWNFNAYIFFLAFGYFESE